MQTQPFETTPKTYARTAGALYLIIAVAGGFSIGYVPSVIVTAADLAANLGLFRLGILGDIIVLFAEVVLTVMLYVMFKPVSATLSLVAAWSRMAMVLVMAVILLLHAVALTMLDEPETVAVLFDAHALGIFVWQLFFGLHLLALGAMIIRSNMFPKVLGWALLVGSFGYSLQGIATLMQVENPVITWAIIALLVIVTLGELAFALWLVIKNANDPVWANANGDHRS